MPAGIIEAHSSVEIPITLKAQSLGKCSITAEVAVFGREGSPLVRARGDVCLEPLSPLGGKGTGIFPGTADLWLVWTRTEGTGGTSSSSCLDKRKGGSLKGDNLSA